MGCSRILRKGLLAVLVTTLGRPMPTPSRLERGSGSWQGAVMVQEHETVCLAKIKEGPTMGLSPGFVDRSSVVTWLSAVVVTVYPPLCAGWRVMVATGLLLGLSWLESRLRVGSSTSGVQIADMSGMLR